MNLNARIIMFAMIVCAIGYRHIDCMGLPTVSGLCQSGAEIFGCRPTRPGTELLSCCAKKNISVMVPQSNEEIDMIHTDAEQIKRKEENSAAQAKYEVAINLFGKDSKEAQKFKPEIFNL